MKKITIVVSLFMASFAGIAQINVFSGNNVGIGAGLATSSSNLSVNTTGNSNTTVYLSALNSSQSRVVSAGGNGTFSCIGVYAPQVNTGSSTVIRGLWGYSYSNTAQSGGQTYGVIGTAGNCTNGYNFGVWGNLNGTNGGTGIYGSVGVSSPYVGTEQYAGYFDGKVKINGQLWTTSGTVTGSDKKIKKSIASLDSSDRIYKLQPKKYFLKTRNELIADGVIKQAVSDTNTVGKAVVVEETPDANKKQHYGFLAQDLQKVYPELVYTAADGTLGVDYQGFIPIIIAQLQTMKQQMDAKDARITALELALAKLK